MSLKDTIMADMKSAMKSKNQAQLTTIRFLQSAIKNREIEMRPNDITDQDVQGVVKKFKKQLEDAIEQYMNAGRSDLADKEKEQLTYLEAYLPAQLSEEQVAKAVDEAIAETGASSMKDMGRVMKVVMDKTAGAADNKIISTLVKSKLQ